MNQILRIFVALLLAGLNSPAAFAQTALDQYSAAGDMAYEAGELEAAEVDYEAALKLAESAGLEDARLVSALRKLGTAYYMSGKFASAEKVFCRALTIDQRMFGENSIDIVDDLNNLIRCLRRQERWLAAEPLIKRALDIRRRSLGEDDRLTANSWLDLAVNYDRQGKLEEAEPGYRMALSIRRKLFGPEHYLLIPALQRYSVLLRKLNRDPEAAELEAVLWQARRKNGLEGATSGAQGLPPARDNAPSLQQELPGVTSAGSQARQAAGTAAASMAAPAATSEPAQGFGQPATFSNPGVPPLLPAGSESSLIPQ